MLNLMRGLVSILASLAQFFERKQLLDAGKKIAKGVFDVTTLKKLRDAIRARRNTALDDDSLRSSPDNRD